MNPRLILPLVVPAASLLCVQVGAATLPVINTNGSGTGSLRQAILDANETPELDTIIFQIPGTGVKTIVLGSGLPPLINPAIIDATTQPGYAGTPLIELSGGNVVNSPALRFLAGNSAVKGLCINRFAAQGIELTGYGNNVVTGNFVGTDPTGSTARPNVLQGVWINNSTGNYVSNNVISGNSEAGIYIMNGSSNRIAGNRIGVTAGGNARLANGANGVSVNSSVWNEIGAGNIISGNAASGVYLAGVGSLANAVYGNKIGLGSDGKTPVGNTADGITVNNAQGNIIGGSDEEARNIISGNNKAGIFLTGAACTNFVEGNFLGTDATGKIAVGNGYAGVTLGRATNNFIVGGNVISGNEQDGVYLSTNSVRNYVLGNIIGLDVTGTTVISNGYCGVTLSSAYNNVVGEHNIISGNEFDGVSIVDGASGNVVRGNFIGIAADGATARPNKRAGVGISKADSNVVGGLDNAAGNVISGNGDAGIFILGGAAVANLVAGNRIGTDASGMLGVSNYCEGIYVRGAASNVISANLISANATWGISLTNTDYNTIRGNTIGTAADRVTPLGNATRVGSGGTRFHTIELAPGCRGNQIGGTLAGDGNLIAYTPSEAGIYYAGIRIRDGSTNNPVVGNTFLGNAGLAIDLGEYLLTENDDCDTDKGANQLQNFPVLSQVVACGNGTAVKGMFNARPNATYRLEFFASSAMDNFGAGEGEVFLGSKTISVGANCTSEFTATFPTPVPSGYHVSATATDPINNTSEFSRWTAPMEAPTLEVSATPGILRLSWPATYDGFSIVETDSLASPVDWKPSEATVTLVDGEYVATIPQVEGATRYFQLAFE